MAKNPLICSWRASDEQTEGSWYVSANGHVLCDSKIVSSCHVETVCLLTHKGWKGTRNAWNQGLSVTGPVALRVMGALLLFSAETYLHTRRRQGCGYDFTFFANESTILLFQTKRENDFTILGRLWLWFYWQPERKRRCQGVFFLRFGDWNFQKTGVIII